MQLRISGYMLAALLLQCASAQAANLVTNPNFTTDVNGWTNAGGLTWDASDGDPAPGSAHITAATSGSSNSSCIVIAAPQNIDLFANIEVASGAAFVEAVAFTDTGCLTGGTSFAFTATSSSSVWQQFSATNVALPSGTNSVLIQLFASLPTVPGAAPVAPVDAHFDQIQFGPTGTLPVRLQSFDVK
jgi:hypothetical protein